MECMRVLVTAGATVSPIDKVRQISNIFKGKTGLEIAREFTAGNKAGIFCSLVTSDPTSAEAQRMIQNNSRLHIIGFKTFEELREIMEQEIRNGQYNVVIHSAAVSDYQVSRVLVPEVVGLRPVDNSAKISSAYSKLYLELEPTIKIIDQIRHPWGFRGKLVKFKLQVGVSDEELITTARKSMHASQADFIVANCLEWYRQKAYIIGTDGSVDSVPRSHLAKELYRRLI